MADNQRLLELPPELLGLVARALLCDDPQADAQAVGRLAASSKALRDLVRGNAAVVAALQAARKMLTLQRQHELWVAAGRLDADAAFPFDPSNYKQVAQQLPAPETALNLRHSRWRVAAAAGGVRGRLAARLVRVNGSLATLDLHGCRIGDEGAKALAAGVAASGSLAILCLGSNQIGDEGAKALAAGAAASGSLVSIGLGNNQIGDEGAKALAEAVCFSGSLAHLNLHSCGIGDEGAKALAASVAASSSLAELILWGNWIGDESATALAEAIRTSGSMAKLFLNDNDVTAAAKQSLRDAVQGRQNFQLRFYASVAHRWPRVA